MNPKIRPYIGVSGVMTADDVATVRRLYETAWGAMEPTHDLMLGVLVSEKTLRNNRNKWPHRYPDVTTIARLLMGLPCYPHENVLNLIHYASDTPPTVDTMMALYGVGGLAKDGYQFNGVWPSPKDLESFMASVVRVNGRADRVVLQVRADRVPFGEIVPQIMPYVDAPHMTTSSVTDILIDASGGQGKAIDTRLAYDVVSLLQAAFRDMFCVGVAGGLSGESLPGEIGALLRRGVSCDAEGRLRDDTEGGGALVYSRVAEYIARAVNFARDAYSVP